ncbi:MAG: hypothetical protein JSS53_09630 [Proteobacteria bacterium]|nr:hypothetical protein [Pseudomonadota bacterium]
MNHKEYPKTIVVKKGIMSVVIIVMVSLLVLILHNLYKASQYTKPPLQEEESIKRVASDEHTRWFKEEQRKIVKAPLKKEQENTHESKEEGVLENEVPYADNTSVSDDHKKAMSASITSNQLIDDMVFIQGREPSVDGKEASSEKVHATSSQTRNQPTEKEAFLSASRIAHSSVLLSGVKEPMSPYELKAGSVIPGILITGLNSDLPGQIVGQVLSNVYDTRSGKYLLVPQGARLVGLYDSSLNYGEVRVLVVWQRIIFPNGESLHLRGMPGVDLSGYAGFEDEVNNHYGKVLGAVMLSSVLSSGAQLSQPVMNNNPYAGPSVGQALAGSLGSNIANTSNSLVEKNLNIQPNLSIRPGYRFYISVTKDIVFEKPYLEVE